MMKHKLLLLFWLLASLLHATKINVDSNTLSAAMTAATSGDTLLLAGGTYSTAINFQNGKTLTLKSARTGSVVFNGTIGGNAITDADCGLIFEGITINRNNSYVMDGSTFGAISIIAFRSDTILNVQRCLVRGGNTTPRSLGTIEITNCIVKNCGSGGYAFLYPKFNVSNIIVRNSTLIRYTGGENFFRPQITNTANVLNFDFENNTVFRWSKNSSYALCYTAAMQSTNSVYTFKNNIIAEPGVNGQVPRTLIATGGNILAKKNLIVNYGRFALNAPLSVDTASNHVSANLYDCAVGFQDTTTVSNDLRILSTSVLATAGVDGAPLGDPRWITTVNSPAVLATAVLPAGAGTIAPAGGTFTKGQSITLTATRAFGFKFKEWRDQDGTTLSTDNPYSFTLNSDKTIKAVFDTLVTYKLTVNKLGDGAAWGNISLSPAPNNSRYESGTIVTASVVPNAVSSFLYWEDASSSSSRQVEMTADHNLSASFDVVPFIVGWDFTTTTPVTNRTADYAYTTDNTGLLSNYSYDGTSTTWGASSKTFGGVTYSCARRYTDLALLQANTPRYLQARFNGMGYKNINIKSKIAADNTTVNKYQKMQYSLDGTNFVTLDSIDLSASYNAAWVDCNATLPQMADSLKKTIYIRWIPVTSSGFMLDATPTSGSTEGFYLANVFVFADKDAPVDTIPPTLISSVPAEASATASANGVITLTFNERVVAGTGSFTFNGKTITPVFGNKTVSFAYTNLSYGTSYNFSIPANALVDLSGNAFKGTTISFSTMSRPQPIARLYDAVVAADGTGDYTTVQAAIDAAPTARTSPWLIFVKNGTYNEYVRIPSNKPFMYLIGQSKEKTIITFAINCSSGTTDSGWAYNKGIWGLSDCAVVVVSATDFYAENISFINKYGVEAQNGPMALAMRSNNDRFAFNNCNFRSFQDTWYTTSNSASDRHYAYKCYIEGAVDYIYGGGDVLFDNCTMYNVRSGSVITAPSHATGTKYGYAFSNCTVDGNSAAADGNLKLGRPWQNAPISLFINTTMKIMPSAEGWTDMGVMPKQFAEYNSMNTAGNAIDLSSRRKYFMVGGVKTIGNVPELTAAQAAQYSYENMMPGSDNWNPRAFFEPVTAPTALSINNRTVSWTKSDYAICYVVLRDTVVIGFTKDNSFTDLTALTGQKYTYTVKAANEFGSLSSPSNAVSYITTGFNETSVDVPVFSVQDECLTVENIKSGSRISLISVDGKLISSDVARSSRFTRNVHALKGIFILKIDNQSCKIVL